MTNRNDLEVAHSRIESLERETRVLAEQNAILTARLEAPSAPRGPTPRSVVQERSSLPTADAETSDEPVATWPITALVAILALATAAAVMFAGNT
jgi:hypothetical protein